MACTAAGGRSNADGSCTIAASLLTEAVTAAAGTKMMAIDMEAGETGANDGSLGGSEATGAYSVPIEHDGTSTMVKIALEGGCGRRPDVRAGHGLR